MNLGFIILRHVNHPWANRYWQTCYKSIRKFYPECKIVIIDDHSNPHDLKEDIELTNTEVVQSEFPGRAELLPYYYYLKHKWFDTACFVHDSLVFQQRIDLSVKTFRFLWSYDSRWDSAYPTIIKDAFEALDGTAELKRFYQENYSTELTSEAVCMGAMTVITHDYLRLVDQKHQVARLLPVITKRWHRMGFERVLAAMLRLNDPAAPPSLLGHYDTYVRTRYSKYACYLYYHYWFWRYHTPASSPKKFVLPFLLPLKALNFWKSRTIFEDVYYGGYDLFGSLGSYKLFRMLGLYRAAPIVKFGVGR